MQKKIAIKGKKKQAKTNKQYTGTPEDLLKIFAIK